jgi:hypothetical protein
MRKRTPRPKPVTVAPFILRTPRAAGGFVYTVKIERLGFKVEKGGFTSRIDAMNWRDEQLKLAPASKKGKNSTITP